MSHVPSTFCVAQPPYQEQGIGRVEKVGRYGRREGSYHEGEDLHLRLDEGHHADRLGRLRGVPRHLLLVAVSLVRDLGRRDLVRAARFRSGKMYNTQGHTSAVRVRANPARRNHQSARARCKTPGETIGKRSLRSIHALQPHLRSRVTVTLECASIFSKVVVRLSSPPFTLNLSARASDRIVTTTDV